MSVSTTLAPDNSGPARVASALRSAISGTATALAQPVASTREKLIAQEEARYSEAFASIVGE